MNQWDALYLMAAPPLLALARYKQWRHGKYRRSLPGMMGGNLPSPPLAPIAAPRHRVWMHAVSVGETIAAAAVYRVLRQRHPDWEFVLTTTTETGQEQARRSMPDATAFDFAPVDFSWKVQAFLDAYQPTAYLFFETEIWPNILLQCGQRNLPVFLVNGKLSDRSARGYARAAKLLRPSLAAVRGFLVQTEDDAARYRMVAGPRATIEVTGNVKFDNLPTPLNAEERDALRQGWGIAPWETVLLVGSTHPGEEILIWEAFRQLASAHAGLRLVVAPRHPERFAAVEEELRRAGAGVHRLSTGMCHDRSAVLLLDAMGVLARSFGAADIALLGGAWNPIGGHNLLEPAAHGIPVVHGPHMHAQRDIMRVVRAHGGTLEVPGEGLAEALGQLLGDPDRRAAIARAGQTAATANRGAATNSVERILELMGDRRP